MLSKDKTRGTRDILLEMTTIKNNSDAEKASQPDSIMFT